MYFASDNSAGVAPQIMSALARANEGYARGYGADAAMARITAQIRTIFDAPEALVHLVATGTAANALSLATLCPPWAAVFCHETAHIEEDECSAPEFYMQGGKLTLVAGTHGKMTPAALRARIAERGQSLHNTQRGAVSLTNVTEPGTVYTAAETAALCAVAREFDLPVHLDGARFANAVVASGASPADLSWRAGVDVLSFGGTKNGLMGVEAVVIFDPAKAPQRGPEFELRRKRGGHLFSKHRYLSAQFEAALTDGLWLDLAAHANRAAARLAAGLARKPGVSQRHPVEANLMFPTWPRGTHARLLAEGAVYYDADSPESEGARLVTSWATSDAEIEAFLSAF